ncbi:hypothetical protein [Streptomyces chrestomyceticus]|uniref:hypothetical protein n=1 Tax=Streptomyces chrestomyceticus TaxID=68185 RepID=UPI0037900216
MQWLYGLLLFELWAADLLGFSRVAVDAGHIRAKEGGPATGPRGAAHRSAPVGRGKVGSARTAGPSKRTASRSRRSPPAAIATALPGWAPLIPLMQAVPPVRAKRGRPLRRPGRPYADRDRGHSYSHGHGHGHGHGYGQDIEVRRDQARQFRITPPLARRGTGHGSGLGMYRRVADRAIALLRWFRRLRTRRAIRGDIHQRSSPLAAPLSAGDDSAPFFVESKAGDHSGGQPA